ncbi:MAG: tetratricopeptide repeat protein [Polyangiaceae bacterium]
MFKVECPGCKAPYQVDERRIPSSGLKMRCPKCGTSFKVDPPGDGRRTGPNSVLGGALGFMGEGDSAPPPALSGASTQGLDLRGTMVGVAPSSAAAPPRPAMPAHLKGTMMGVAPAAAGGALPPPRPAVPAHLKGTMMGVAPAAPSPGRAPPLPPRRAPEAKPASPPEGARAPSLPDPDSFFDDADLPAAVAPRAAVPLAHSAARPAAPSEPDLPAPLAPQPFDDLPAAASSHVFDDLPVAASANTRSSTPFSLDLDLDLPSLGGATTAAARTVSVRPLSSGLDLDLPTLGTRTAAPNVGLPSISARVPSPTAGAASLPSPVRRGSSHAEIPATRPAFGEVGLPEVAGAGLPEVSRASLPARAGVELPSLGGRPRMPSGGFDLDDGLPLVSGNLAAFAGGDLPALGGVGLPERGQAGLPALGGGLPAYAASGLPMPSAQGLPVHQGSGLPVPVGAAFPSQPPVENDFELERVPSLPPDFGAEAVPPANSRGSRADFGDLELPLEGAPSVPPTRGGSMPYGEEGEEADLFGGLPAPGFGPGPGVPRERAAPEALVRQSGGGTAYGEVNLGDEGVESALPIDSAPGPGRRDEDMEFGAIPQEDQPRPDIGTATGPTHAAMPVGRGAPEVLKLKRKRKLDVRLYGGLFVLFVGGASLALVPSVGPFGAYVVIDKLKAGEYAQLVASTVAKARGDMARDTYPAAKDAIEVVDAARASVKRVHELAAYAAFTAYAEELRFGSDPAIHARASVLLDELAERTETPFMPLARCARAAAEGQMARAHQLFDGLPRSPAADPDQAFLQGEIALRAGDPTTAAAVWQKILRAQRSPRSAFGLARATYAAGDMAAATAAARDTLAQNPEHVGARVLLARISGATRSGEAEALRLLSSIAKTPGRASPDEMVSSQTLLGDIHLARSRMSQAEGAYNEALKINPKAARALNGLGDALYRAGRFSEAQARFEASTQADPDDLSAKIGVAKSKLALERVEDAASTLKKLRDTYPTSVPVAYWYGRALEAGGSRALAETVYRGALKTPSHDPQMVDVYIALALLQSQQGNNDDATKTLADARANLPDLPVIRKALGDVALSQGRYAPAIKEFRQAVALDNEDLGAKFKLGVALRRDGKFEEAGKSFDDVSAVDKDYPGLALERGLLYEASGRLPEALKEYEGALPKAPKDPDLMLRAGCANVAAGRAKQGEELLRKVLSERPSSAETNYCLGRALLLEGTRLAESTRFLERAVELDPNHAEYQLYAGWVYNEAGNVPKAEHALAEALRLDQGLADAYWQRGVLRQRQGVARDAIADLTKALELRPSRYEAHAALADAYYDLGKEPRALAEWQLAIQAQPDNYTWRFRYGKLLAANHQTEAAKEQLSKSLDLAASEDPAPRWAWEAHNLLAHAIGLKPEAIKHWEEFLRLGPRDSPYRAEAKTSLEKLGHPWSGD